MRLWTLSPKYLDQKGLVALWREALLAQKVLIGDTKGYRNHPQLIRFKNHPQPLAAIACYLSFVYDEALARGYNFQKNKIILSHKSVLIETTEKQVLYEWQHLKEKLKIRDKKQYNKLMEIVSPEVNPSFYVVEGEIEKWEIVKNYRS